MNALPGSCRFSRVQFPGSTSHLALSDGNSSEIISKLIYVLGVTETQVQTPSCSDTARVRAGLRICPESQPSS